MPNLPVPSELPRSMAVCFLRRLVVGIQSTRQDAEKFVIEEQSPTLLLPLDHLKRSTRSFHTGVLVHLSPQLPFDVALRPASEHSALGKEAPLPCQPPLPWFQPLMQPSLCNLMTALLLFWR